MNVVLGRKFCSSCRRWRPVSDFTLWRDTRRGDKLRLMSQCQACSRAQARIRMGLKERGKPYGITSGAPYGASRWSHCLAGHPLDGPKADTYRDYLGFRRCAICRREFDRFAAERKRRAAGVKPRGLKRRTRWARGERRSVPVAPFLEIVRERRQAGASWEDLARLFGIDGRQLRRYEDGSETKIHIDTVDAALIADGSRTLWELYPELYEEETNGRNAKSNRAARERAPIGTP